MRVNGKEVCYEPVTLLEYLRRGGYDPGHVVIERNMEIITKERFGEIVPDSNDEINILQFMGGG